MKTNAYALCKWSLISMMAAWFVPSAYAEYVPRPDFTVSSIVLDPVPTSAGETFDANVTIRNDGEVSADAGLLRVWISQATAVPSGTAGDAEEPAGILNAGESKVITFSGLSAAGTAGTHQFRAFIDADGAANELSEGNNQFTSTYTLPAAPVVIVPPVITPSGRVEDNLLSLYTFGKGFGETVYDQISHLDLTIHTPDPQGYPQWLPGGGLRFTGGSASSDGLALSLVTALKATNELTVETWIRPENLTQGGPARIVSLSSGWYDRDFTLGQTVSSYVTRLRSTGTNANGTPEKLTPASTVEEELQHVVFTRNAAGLEVIYVDGTAVSSRTVSGNFSNWNDFALVLGNETTNDRPWLGDMFLAAVYDRSLTPEEVTQNFEAGVVEPVVNCTPESDNFITGPGFQSFWSLYDPVGDAEAGLTGTDALLSVPSGIAHDLWKGSGNLAPRMLQETADGDFAIETRFLSMPAQKYQMQGLIVQEDDDTFLRFGTYFDGGGLQMFVAFIDGNSATALHGNPPSGGVLPHLVRVERQGDTWTYRYSGDGISWYTAAVFDLGMAVTESGFYAGNADKNYAYTARVDYFRHIGCEFPAPETWKKPDFSVTAVDLIPVPADTGTSFNVDVTIRNNGVLAGDAGQLRIWSDHVAAAFAGEPGDGVIPAGELAVGESRTLTFTGLLSAAASGTYHVRAYVDADDETAEFSEGDNQLTATYSLADDGPSGPAPWEKPDFTVTSVVLTPVPSAPDETFTATVTVKNAGVLAGNAGVLRVLAHGTAVVADLPVGPLGIGESATLEFPGLTAPSTSGTFHTQAFVDADLLTDELSEGNNTLTATYTLAASGGAGDPATWTRPDFAVTSISFVGPAPTTTGQPYTVRVTVANNGLADGNAGNVYLYPSKAGYALPGDIGSAAVNVPVGSLAAGASTTFDVQLTTPLTRGVHHTRAYVVSPETEWSTGDNQASVTSWIKAVTLSITPVGGDLELQWNNYWGDSYTLYRSVDAGDFLPLASGIPSARPAEFNTYVDTPPAGVVMYRVEIDSVTP